MTDQPTPRQPYPHIVDHEIRSTAIDGLQLITQKQITDGRGTVREFFRSSAYRDVLPAGQQWEQINVTQTHQGALRGMHGEAMVKLVACVAGEAYGVYLDARDDSPTRGAVVRVPLTLGTQVLVPAGVCNGFQAVSEGGCQYLYCFTAEWVPGMAGVAYSPLDPGLGVRWPLSIDTANSDQVSAKDASAPLFFA